MREELPYSSIVYSTSQFGEYYVIIGDDVLLEPGDKLVLVQDMSIPFRIYIERRDNGEKGKEVR